MMRRYQIRHLTMTIAALLLLAATANAGDHPNDRKGLMLGFGFGGAGAELTYQRLGSEVKHEFEDGHTGSLWIGYGVSDHVVLGLEGVCYRDDRDVGDTEICAGLFTVTWFPGGGGFYLRGGLGGSVTTLDLNAPDNIHMDEHEADAGIIGLGYEWRLGRQFALGVGVDAVVTDFEDEFLFEDAYLGFGSASLKLNWYL